ncbi:MAG TPA: UDP-N-acetylmuramoyl-L-alanyl-D-glutamate--2,6-diaminopimelate ligase, partial [Erysipelotrichaceae bacterium]|nr:UDP-N-acetylmuramoyl-L-alanyl-D-glutamate--2,6-diaminopimelate ligase [Erysipelotrichaceae bacterium]
NLVKEDGVSVINKDDEKYGALKDCSKARVISYAINSEADYRAINIKMSSQGTQFDLVYSGHMYPVKTNLVGNFNVYNLLAAIAALNETGYDLERIIEKCAHIAQV